MIRQLLGSIILASIVAPGAGQADGHAQTSPAPFFDRSLQGGLFVDPLEPLPLPPPEPDPNVLRPGGQIFIQRRDPDNLRIVWGDRTDVELGYTIKRAHVGREFAFPTADDWIVVGDLGPQDGFPTFTDSGLIADEIYCYRAEVFDAERRLPGSVRCARIAVPGDFQVFRAVFSVTVADIDNAGTDDLVEMGLTNRALIEPSGNRTWLDYSRDDFERGETGVYDLDLRGVTTTHDITLIDIRKSGSDDLCVARVALEVNGRGYFEHRFDDQSDGCVWINAGSNNRLEIPFSDLRAHDDWGSFNPINVLSNGTLFGIADGSAFSAVHDDGPIPIGRDLRLDLSPQTLGLLGGDLQSRIESVIGNTIQGIEVPFGFEVEWAKPSGDATSIVTLERVSDERIAVRFAIIGSHWLPDVDIDGQFDLRFTLACVGDDAVRFVIRAENIVIDADTPLGAFEGGVQDAIDSQSFSIPSIGQTFSLGDLPGDGEAPDCHETMIEITSEANVLPTVILRELFVIATDPPGPATDEDPAEPTDDGDAPDTGPADPGQ